MYHIIRKNNVKATSLAAIASPILLEVCQCYLLRFPFNFQHQFHMAAILISSPMKIVVVWEPQLTGKWLFGEKLDRKIKLNKTESLQ